MQWWQELWPCLFALKSGLTILDCLTVLDDAASPGQICLKLLNKTLHVSQLAPNFPSLYKAGYTSLYTPLSFGIAMAVASAGSKGAICGGCEACAPWSPLQEQYELQSL